MVFWLFSTFVMWVVTGDRTHHPLRGVLGTDPVADVDEFVSIALNRVGADNLISRRDEESVVRSVYRLVPGADPMEVASRIRTLAQEEGIEIYITQVDGLDAEIRIYAGPALRQYILLVPKLPAFPTLKHKAQGTQRPLVSIIITGIGAQDVSKLLQAEYPLTLGILPYKPFSLRIAREAALHWHEVLVHLPLGLSEQDKTTGASGSKSLADATNAVPYATGVAVDGAVPSELPAHPFWVVVHPEAYDAPKGSRHQLLSAQRSGRLHADEVLARTLHLAIRDGSAVLLVDANDPGLPNLLAWADTADEEGFHLVLASEAYRADQVRGGEWREGTP